LLAADAEEAAGVALGADAAEAAEAADAAAAPGFVTGACWRLPLAMPEPASRGATIALAAALAAALADAAGTAAFAGAALLAAAASTFAAGAGVCAVVGAGVCAIAVPIEIVATATVIINLLIEFFILLPIVKSECAVENHYVCP
jgi:hypothetical protein